MKILDAEVRNFIVIATVSFFILLVIIYFAKNNKPTEKIETIRIEQTDSTYIEVSGKDLKVTKTWINK
jgi:hypothetical protein